MANKIPELGHKVQDLVTGFEGTITATTHYLNGCIRACVSRYGDGTEKWIDLEQLRVVDENKIQIPRLEVVSHGGGEDPTERATDTRS